MKWDIDEAQKRFDEITGVASDVNVEVKLDNMKHMDEYDKDILVEALQIYKSVINTLYDDSEWLYRYNEFHCMVNELGGFVGWDLTDCI